MQIFFSKTPVAPQKSASTDDTGFHNVAKRARVEPSPYS